MSSAFFNDCMSDPNINWGTFPLKIKHQLRKREYGVLKTLSVVEEDFDAVSSPQLLEQDELEKLGLGDWSSGDVYVCFTLKDIPLNRDNSDYRTILFNGREFEKIKSSFFGVNRGTEFEDGYYEVVFGRRIEYLGV